MSEAGRQARHLADSLEQAALLACNGKITYANAAAATLLGWNKDDPAAMSLRHCLAHHAQAGEGWLLIGEQTAPRPSHLRKQDAIALPLHAAVKPSDQVGEQVSRETLVLLQAGITSAPALPATISMESFPWPVMRLDLRGRYLQGNAAALQLTDVHVCPSEGLSLAELGWPASACRTVEQAIASMHANAGTRNLMLPWAAEKKEEYFQADLLTETDAAGIPASVLLLLREPVENTPALDEIQLHKARHACEQARAAATARDAFLGWLAHELRSPLNGIQSWTHILETYVSASTTSPLATRAMQGIRNGVAQQLRMLEELLDISRVIEGRLSLGRLTFALKPLAQSAVDSVRALAGTRQLTMSFHSRIQGELMESDPCRVQQCMSLLLSYAITMSPSQGLIRISLDGENHHGVLRITHADGSEGLKETTDACSPAFPRPPSRQEMDLLLVRCLAEMLEGRFESERNSARQECIYTLALPLKA